MVKGQRRDVFRDKEGWDWWKIAAVVFGVLFLVSIFTGGFTNMGLKKYSKISAIDGQITLTVLNDANCVFCNTSLAIDTLTSLVPNLKVKEVEFLSEEGVALVNNYSLFTLPSYLFDKNVEESDVFSNISGSLINVSDRYLVNPFVIGAAKYIFVPREDDDYILGDRGAPLTLFMYSNLDCAECARFFLNTFPKIKTNYIDTGIIKFVVKDLLVGESVKSEERLNNLLTRSVVLNCAGEQGKYFEMLGALFKRQNENASLNDLTGELKLDSQRLLVCAQNSTKADEILRDNQDASRLGVLPVAPTFLFNNGIIIIGAQSYETFDVAIKGAILELQNAALVQKSGENKTIVRQG